MNATELLDNLVLRKISVSQGLLYSRVHFKDSLTEQSYQWICHELNKYDDPTQLPDYRIVDCEIMVRYKGTPFTMPEDSLLDTSLFKRMLEKSNKPYGYPNKMLVFQGVESIEQLIESSGSTIVMPLSQEQIDLILRYYLNPSGLVESMYQETRIEYIKNIISCVRNRLISILETEVLSKNKNVRETDSSASKSKKRVFISYGWDDEDHKKWVLSLAEKLSCYYDVIIDKKVPFGSDINLFMEQMISQADRVLLILTPMYKCKADNRQNGVGYESVLISEELYQNQATTKFIPILRRGTFKESCPRFLGSRKGLDMTNDSNFEVKFEELVEDLRNN